MVNIINSSLDSLMKRLVFYISPDPGDLAMRAPRQGKPNFPIFSNFYLDRGCPHNRHLIRALVKPPLPPHTRKRTSEWGRFFSHHQNQILWGVDSAGHFVPAFSASAAIACATGRKDKGDQDKSDKWKSDLFHVNFF